MWIGVIMICANVTIEDLTITAEVQNCHAMVRNSILFDNEQECRQVVPYELDLLTQTNNGWGKYDCLPLDMQGPTV
jgi:hypothetical protein